MGVFYFLQGGLDRDHVFAPAVTDDTGADSTVGEHFLEQFEVIEQEVIGIDLIGQQGDVGSLHLCHQVSHPDL
ncbi:hypothetical protein D3C85_1688780 [compost metagenome]